MGRVFSQSERLTDAMRSVFVELLVHGPMSRAEVARRLALSPSALTKVTKPFIETGYLREQLTGEGPSTVGRTLSMSWSISVLWVSSWMVAARSVRTA